MVLKNILVVKYYSDKILFRKPTHESRTVSIDGYFSFQFFMSNFFWSAYGSPYSQCCRLFLKFIFTVEVAGMARRGLTVALSSVLFLNMKGEYLPAFQICIPMFFIKQIQRSSQYVDYNKLYVCLRTLK